MSRGDMLARRAPADRGRIQVVSGDLPSAPSAIAGYCWDLDPELGITYGAGGAGAGLVAAMSDQSPSAVHVAQATGSLQPTRVVADASFNGHDSIDHSVLDANLAVSASLGIRHIFCVAKHPLTTFGTYACLLTSTSANPWSPVWLGDSGNANWRLDGFEVPGTFLRDGVVTGAALSAANAAHAYERVFTALKTTSTWMVGHQTPVQFPGRQWGGRWARIIGFNLPVVGTDLVWLRAYLQQRYGTP